MKKYSIDSAFGMLQRLPPWMLRITYENNTIIFPIFIKEETEPQRGG